jgi:predicted RNase H-like nuclease (RuvC/YqgF family)
MEPVMTREEMEREIKDLEAYVQWKQDDIDKLKARYSGVRPSWVSGDIGWDMVHIENARAEIADLKSKLEAETAQ